MNPRQKGAHTWDTRVYYHRCPKCGYILEDRMPFEYRLGKYVKDLVCSRCSAEFQVEKSYVPTFGPLWD